MPIGLGLRLWAILLGGAPFSGSCGPFCDFILAPYPSLKASAFSDFSDHICLTLDALFLNLLSKSLCLCQDREIRCRIFVIPVEQI